MKTITTAPVTYELEYDPTNSATLVRCTVHHSPLGGVITPLAASIQASSRRNAEQQALRYGLTRSGPWLTSSRGRDYCQAAPII